MNKRYTIPENATELNELADVLRKTFTLEQRQKIFKGGMTNKRVVEILNAELDKRNG